MGDNNVICKKRHYVICDKNEQYLISNCSMEWFTILFTRVVFASETESSSTFVTYVLVLLEVILIIMFLCPAFSVVRFVTVDIRAVVGLFSD